MASATQSQLTLNFKRKNGDEANENSPKKKPRWNQRYKQQYSVAYPCITKSVKGETYAHCTVCNCDISVAHGGMDDIKRHVGREKHSTALKSVSTIRNMDTYFVKQDDFSVIRAECMYVTHLLEKNIPINSMEKIGSLFKSMFPDSKIASNFACGRTKTHAIINEMANDTIQQMSLLMKSNAYSLSTDGSNDSDSKLYPIVARVFNPSSSCVEVTLISLPNLMGDSTGKNNAKEQIKAGMSVMYCSSDNNTYFVMLT